MNDSDEILRQHFRALRTDDARHAPSFESTLQLRSAPLPAQSSAVARHDRRSRVFWQLGLGTAVAAIALVGTQYRPDFSASQQHHPPAHTNLPTAETWTAPSDVLIADTSDPLETSAHLIREIDRLLNRTPRHL